MMHEHGVDGGQQLAYLAEEAASCLGPDRLLKACSLRVTHWSPEGPMDKRTFALSLNGLAAIRFVEAQMDHPLGQMRYMERSILGERYSRAYSHSGQGREMS
jgi:hypothetical protein